jgi:hypothetical protein
MKTGTIIYVAAPPSFAVIKAKNYGCSIIVRFQNHIAIF